MPGDDPAARQALTTLLHDEPANDPADDAAPALADGSVSTVGQLVDAALAHAPDADRARGVIDLATLLARHVEGPAAAGALAVAAWTAWNVGENVRAEFLSVAALERDSSHRLARLVAQVLLVGLAPRWVGTGQGAVM